MGRSFLISWLVLSSLGMNPAQGATTTLLATSNDHPVEVGSRPQQIGMHWVVNARHLLGSGRRVILIARGIWASEPPNTGYGLFLELTQHRAPDSNDPGYIGAISFYGVPRQYDPADPRDLSFDLSHALQQLQATGRLSEHPTLSIVPLDEKLATGRAGVNHFEVRTEKLSQASPKLD
jgi:hypothetical protein